MGLESRGDRAGALFLAQKVGQNFLVTLASEMLGQVSFDRISRQQFKEPSMQNYKKYECEEFLQRFQHWEDPSWGFYVYGSYERRNDAHSSIDETQSHAQETAGEASQDNIARVQSH
jgi:hypothetical protein